MARLGKRERSFWTEAVKQAIKKAKIDGLEFAQNGLDAIAKDLGRNSVDLFLVLQSIAKGEGYQDAGIEDKDVIKTGVRRPSRLGKDYKATGFKDGRLINFYDQVETDAAKESRQRRLDWLTEQPGVLTRKPKSIRFSDNDPKVERKHSLPTKPKGATVSFKLRDPITGKITAERAMKLKQLRELGYKVRVIK